MVKVSKGYEFRFGISSGLLSHCDTLTAPLTGLELIAFFLCLAKSYLNIIRTEQLAMMFDDDGRSNQGTTPFKASIVCIEK